VLSGPEYDNFGVWHSARWDLAARSTKDHKQRTVEYHLGTTCRSRAQLYHALIHFKYRLIERVRTKLREHGGSVNALVCDEEFMTREYRRFVEVREHLDAQAARGDKSGRRVEMNVDWSLYSSDDAGGDPDSSDDEPIFDDESDFE